MSPSYCSSPAGYTENPNRVEGSFAATSDRATAYAHGDIHGDITLTPGRGSAQTEQRDGEGAERRPRRQKNRGRGRHETRRAESKANASKGRAMWFPALPAGSRNCVPPAPRARVRCQETPLALRFAVVWHPGVRKTAAAPSFLPTHPTALPPRCGLHKQMDLDAGSADSSILRSSRNLVLPPERTS